MTSAPLDQPDNEIRLSLPAGRRLGQTICDAIKYGRPTADNGDLYLMLRHVADERLMDWIEAVIDGHLRSSDE